MRQIVLDTETTGLEWSQGHRVIEIGCVELEKRRLTGRHYHVYLRPDREVDEGAAEVHGLTNEFLADKPPFADVVDEFLEFLGTDELIIHNADFDLGFLDYELRLLDAGAVPLRNRCAVLDTLPLARQMHPGQRNSLDALCKRYAVDNSRRNLHGALLDAELLAGVYLAMTGGQTTLSLESASEGAAVQASGGVVLDRSGLELVVREPSDADLAAHEQQLAEIDNACPDGALWKRLIS